MVYSEELVDRSIMKCQRSENERLGTVDFRHPDGKLIFSTVPHERVAFQLGTASATDALQAALVVAKDVRAIDINMGCPVKFSTQGGMGSALLTQPEKVHDILTTLVRNLEGKPVTCKIRLLETPQETLSLAKLIASCGVSALAVHARRRSDRPRFWSQWEQFRLLRDSLDPALPLVLNGDLFDPQDIPRAYELTGADSLMLARGAMWNPSLFSREPDLRPQHEMLERYVCLARQMDNNLGNTKYVAQKMLEGHGKSVTFKRIQGARDYDGLAEAARAMSTDPYFSKPLALPVTLEPPPDLPHLTHHPINSWRSLPPHWRAPKRTHAETLEIARTNTDHQTELNAVEPSADHGLIDTVHPG